MKSYNKKSNYFSIMFIFFISIVKVIFDIYFFKISFNKSIIYVSFLILPIVIMYLLKKYVSIKSYTINFNNKLLLAFIFVYAIQELIFLFIQSSKIKLDNSKMFIFQIILILILFLSYFYLRVKFNIEKIHLNINCKNILIGLIIGIIYLCLKRLQNNTGEIHIFKMIISFISLLFYPSLYEEFLYRGFFIGGIKKFKLEDYWINIIQALIFGLVHYNQFSQYGAFGILGTSNQILVGYLLGQVYYYTGSLAPCIIIHAFFNLI